MFTVEEKIRTKTITIYKYMCAQSFTLLMADVCQDINAGSAFRRFLNGTFP